LQTQLDLPALGLQFSQPGAYLFESLGNTLFPVVHQSKTGDNISCYQDGDQCKEYQEEGIIWHGHAGFPGSGKKNNDRRLALSVRKGGLRMPIAVIRLVIQYYT
jgi:hypothetical protein